MTGVAHGTSTRCYIAQTANQSNPSTQQKNNKKKVPLGRRADAMLVYLRNHQQVRICVL